MLHVLHVIYVIHDLLQIWSWRGGVEEASLDKEMAGAASSQDLCLTKELEKERQMKVVREAPKDLLEVEIDKYSTEHNRLARLQTTAKNWFGLINGRKSLNSRLIYWGFP